MSQAFDLIVRGAAVVTPQGIVAADIGVAGGRIVRIAPDLEPDAREVIEATGLHALPGVVDSHVHFNEPGRADWEGLASGSSALAAGGGTTFFDMPLNSLPPVTDAASFALKRAAAERSSVTDFGLWGGLVPGNEDALGEMAEAGAVGFKAFMCSSGVDEFPFSDPLTLRKGMIRAAKLGLPVAVHAEDETLARLRTAQQRALGTDVRTWLGSRPPELELVAIRTATDIAGETGAALHLVHVSTPEGVSLALEARARGVNVSIETCPHYLLLTEEDVVRLGAPAKCFPPLRPETSRRGLWAKLESGGIDTLGSDHSPAPPDMKRSTNFFEIWGGVSGCQHGFGLTVSEALGRLPEAEALALMSAVWSSQVAARFRIAHAKGSLVEGLDADITLLDLRDEHRLSNAELLYRHRQGPYDGRESRVGIRRTIVGGRTVWADGRIAPGTARGHLVRPA